jgi:hypothetical protein
MYAKCTWYIHVYTNKKNSYMLVYIGIYWYITCAYVNILCIVCIMYIHVCTCQEMYIRIHTMYGMSNAM